jgi:hypothetical protein
VVRSSVPRPPSSRRRPAALQGASFPARRACEASAETNQRERRPSRASGKAVTFRPVDDGDDCARRPNLPDLNQARDVRAVRNPGQSGDSTHCIGEMDAGQTAGPRRRETDRDLSSARFRECRTLKGHPGYSRSGSNVGSALAGLLSVSCFQRRKQGTSDSGPPMREGPIAPAVLERSMKRRRGHRRRRPVWTRPARHHWFDGGQWNTRNLHPLRGSTLGPANAGRKFTPAEIDEWKREHGE